MMIVIFTAALVLLFLVTIVLSVYICKSKAKRHRRGSSSSSSTNGIRTLTPYNQQASNRNEYQQQRSHAMMPNNAVYPLSSPSRPESVSSRLSNGESVSSQQILNPLNPRSGSQRYAKNGMLRMTATVKSQSPAILAPPPPSPSIHSSGLPEAKILSVSEDPMPNGTYVRNGYRPTKAPRAGMPPRQGSVNSLVSNSARSSSMMSESEVSLNQMLRDSIVASSSKDLTRINWPRNSIPRRVKKLSWEDEFGTTSRDREISTLMTDPNLSVTPLDNSNQPHVGRPIYF